jgi:hypothetical protein
VSATHVFYTHEPAFGLSATSIMRAPKTGGPGETVAQARAILAAASRGADVFYLDDDGGSVFVVRVSMDGGGASRVATASGKGAKRATGLALDDADVFWLWPNDSVVALRTECQVLAAPRVGGAVRLVAKIERQCADGDAGPVVSGDRVLFATMTSREDPSHPGPSPTWITERLVEEAPAAGGEARESAAPFDLGRAYFEQFGARFDAATLGGGVSALDGDAVYMADGHVVRRLALPRGDAFR